ncbi:uncharacterized protein FTOL_02115 [Fusarium torulosum]|uniref:Uncharacterized protein n=1 Tax=Fusarium torulosum TaxID=33205 RepID=A0AAE8M1E7_9HYPO|nr:uncharacterized protein FTOL_02115 [Fusarium torulosum]
MKSLILYQLGLLMHYAMVMASFPSMCLYNPVQMEAGISLVTLKITNAPSASCTASLFFEDPDFLPITYNFKPIACSGTELVSFPVPLGVPSGEAYILWQCAGESPTCIRASISGGHSGVDPDIGPLQITCEMDSINDALTQLYPSAAFLPIPKFYPSPSTTTVTELITKPADESRTRPVQVITLTNTVVVDRKEEAKTPTAFPVFAHNPVKPTPCSNSGPSTPTPEKIRVGTIGTGGLPMATMSHSKMNLVEVTSAASTTRHCITYAAGFMILTIYLFT